MTGPNDDMSAAVASSAWEKLIDPAATRWVEAATMAMSKTMTAAPVAAMNRAVFPLRLSSMPAKRSMDSPSSRARSAARPNWSVSRRPRSESSTKVFIPPISSRIARPAPPLAREATAGTATPIVR